MYIHLKIRLYDMVNFIFHELKLISMYFNVNIFGIFFKYILLESGNNRYNVIIN